MSQRNPMNPRSQAKDHKGSSRKSSSSAKLKSTAGASVRPASSAAKVKGQARAKAAADKAEAKRERQREMAMSAQASQLPEYKKWRKRWVVVIALAIVSVVVGWGFNALVNNGILPPSCASATETVMVVGMVFGYVFIFAALFIDFARIRPIRKKAEAKAAHMSKREKRALDEAIAAGSKAKSVPKGGKAVDLPWKRKKTDAEPKAASADAEK